MMAPPDIVAVFLRPLHSTGLSYMVTGSVAAAIYGEPRLTQDVDLVLTFPDDRAERIVRAFSGDDYYVPPLQVLREEAGRENGGHFNLLHHETGLRADCYMAGDDPLCAWGLAHCRSVAVGDDSINVAPPEYVILAKLRYVRAGGGEKHLSDIARMLRVTGDAIDRSEIEARVREMGLGNEWRLAVETYERLRSRPD